jgi:hypothetical protein
VIVFVAVAAVLAFTVAAFAWSGLAGRASGAPPGTVPIGRGHVPVLPDRPAVMDGPHVMSVIGPLRRVVKAPALTHLTCLDAAAQRYAQQVADALGSARPVPKAEATTSGSVVQPGCGGVLRSGFVVGPDASGVSQARVSYGNANGDPRHPSALLAKDSRAVGYGLAAERVRGQVVGYVLAWVVTS